jgi:type I restriction enzyme S subunit
VSWPLVELGSVLKVVGGYAFKSKEFVEDGFPIIRISNIDGINVNLEKAAKVPEEIIKGKERFRVNSGDILIAMSGATTGKLGVVPERVSQVYLNQRVGKFDFDSIKLHNKFLYYFLLSDVCQTQINALAAGAAQPNISGGQIESIMIPLPPLTVQKKIAAALEKADTLRGQCQQMEQEFNTLAQSVFLDMFGDPVANPNSWNTSSLEQVCHDIYRYPTFYGFDYIEQGVPVVKIGNITKDGYVGNDLSKYDFMPSEKCNEYPRTILKMFDIVMAVRGDGSTGKRIGLVDSDNIIGSNISPNLIMFRANNELVHPVFLYYFLTSKGGQAKIDKYITKTAKKSITGKDIKKIEMYVPPLKLQLDFVRIHMKYRKQLLLNRNTTNFSSSLFNCLMQCAFKGELKLKDVA